MGLMDQMKQAKQLMQMRKEAKKLQAEVEKITCEYANGGISCVARGDMTVVSVKVSEESLKEVVAGHPERFEIMLTNVINGALKTVKKETQDKMATLMKGSDLGGMLGQ